MLLSPLVCSPPELPTAAPVHLVREPVRPAAADHGRQVPGGPRRGRGPALPGPALLVRPLQQGTSVMPGPLPSSRSVWSVYQSQLSRENSISQKCQEVRVGLTL